MKEERRKDGCMWSNKRAWNSYSYFYTPYLYFFSPLFIISPSSLHIRKLHISQYKIFKLSCAVVTCWHDVEKWWREPGKKKCEDEEKEKFTKFSLENKKIKITERYKGDNEKISNLNFINFQKFWEAQKNSIINLFYSFLLSAKWENCIRNKKRARGDYS